jgi:hypothetical protein
MGRAHAAVCPTGENRKAPPLLGCRSKKLAGLKPRGARPKRTPLRTEGLDPAIGALQTGIKARTRGLA